MNLSEMKSVWLQSPRRLWSEAAPTRIPQLWQCALWRYPGFHPGSTWSHPRWNTSVGVKPPPWSCQGCCSSFGRRGSVVEGDEAIRPHRIGVQTRSQPPWRSERTEVTHLRSRRSASREKPPCLEKEGVITTGTGIFFFFYIFRTHLRRPRLAVPILVCPRK